MSRLPPKLRIYAGLVGGALVVTSLWVALAFDGRPGSSRTLAVAAVIGGLVVVTPVALAYGKRGLERRRHAGLDQETYASSPLPVERRAFIATTVEALTASEAFEAVKERSFPEGPGLIVDHTAFHGTFVRLSGAGRIVVTGVRSRATRTLVEELESIWSTSFEQTAVNPFVGPIPVRGAPRVFLVLLLTTVAIVDLALVAGVAYPSPAYNHGEKAALLGYDAAVVVSPGTTQTDADIAKADFLVAVLREEATEIRWEAGLNGTEGVPEHDADEISADIERLLERARASDPGPTQRSEIERIDSDFAGARRAVTDAVAAVENGTATADGPPLPGAATPTPSTG